MSWYNFHELCSYWELLHDWNFLEKSDSFPNQHFHCNHSWSLANKIWFEKFSCLPSLPKEIGSGDVLSHYAAYSLFVEYEMKNRTFVPRRAIQIQKWSFIQDMWINACKYIFPLVRTYVSRAKWKSETTICPACHVFDCWKGKETDETTLDVKKVEKTQMFIFPWRTTVLNIIRLIMLRTEYFVIRKENINFDISKLPYELPRFKWVAIKLTAFETVTNAFRS